LAMNRYRLGSFLNEATGWFARQSLAAYLELFKPRQTALLVATGVLGYLIASGGGFGASLYLILLALVLAVAGTTGLNMYFDREVDSAMFRTKRRPIPSGRISPRAALLFSLPFLFGGITLAFSVNSLAGLFVAAGSFIDLALYTILLKRKTALNIVVGSLAGGMPAVAGYAASASRVDLLGFSLLLLVSLWSMAHIWLIASYYVEDYRRAGVPMLPVLHGIRKSVLSSLGILLAMNLTLFSLWLLRFVNFWPLLVSLLFSLPLSGILIYYLRHGGRENLRRAYRILSPYLLAIFLIILLAGIQA